MREDSDERLDRFESALGELRGQLRALEQQVARLLDQFVATPDKHSTIKTVITFMAIVVVPIMVALLGGYFALRAAGLR